MHRVWFSLGLVRLPSIDRDKAVNFRELWELLWDQRQNDKDDPYREHLPSCSVRVYITISNRSDRDDQEVEHVVKVVEDIRNKGNIACGCIRGYLPSNQRLFFEQIAILDVIVLYYKHESSKNTRTSVMLRRANTLSRRRIEKRRKTLHRRRSSCLLGSDTRFTRTNIVGIIVIYEQRL